VVAAHDVGVNLGDRDALDEARRHQKVIDAPADVSRTSVREIRPPRVVAVAFVKQSKGVDETGVEEVLKALALLRRESSLSGVGLWIGEVVGRVRHVEVAAEDDGLHPFKFLDVVQERGVPLTVTKVQPSEVVLRVRGVHVHDEEVRELRGEDAPFVVRVTERIAHDAELVDRRLGQSRRHADGRDLREVRGAGVTLLLCGVPMLLVRRQIDFRLELLRLGLLQTDDVGIERFDEGREETFLAYSTDTVDVPRDEAHLENVPTNGVRLDEPRRTAMSIQ